MIKRVAIWMISVGLSASVAQAAITATGGLNVFPADPNTWTASTFASIGSPGTGSVTVDGGSDLLSGYSAIGGSPVASNGTVTVTGGGSTWTNSHDIAVGLIGSGTLNIAGGGLVEVIENTFVAPSVGKIDLDNGTLTTGAFLGGVGVSDLDGSGTINTHGLVSDVDLTFDTMASLTQTLTLNDSGRNIAVNLTADGSAAMGAGYSGSGSMDVSGGVALLSIDGYLGYQSGSTGAATVSGFGSAWANFNDLTVGLSGVGTLGITDSGFVIVGGVLTIEDNGGGDSFINMSTGGMLALAGDAAASLTAFLGLIEGTDDIRYWDGSISDWADIAGATPGEDYRLSVGQGDLTGYTVLLVPEPATMGLLALGGFLMVLRRRRKW